MKYTEQDQWQTQAKVTDLPLKDVFFSDKDHGWIAGGYQNEEDFQSILLKTYDGGITWREKEIPKYLINDMFFKDSLNGFAVGNDTIYFEWTTWRVVGSWRGVILKTTNGGENWFVEVGDLPASLKAIQFKDGFVWAVGDNGLVLRTDNWTTWVDQNTGKTYPSIYRLSQNYPNPFNPITRIDYQLPKTSDIDISIYNLLVQKVAALVNKKQNAGTHQIEWDASGFASGIYYYKIKAVNFTETRKMIYLK